MKVLLIILVLAIISLISIIVIKRNNDKKIDIKRQQLENQCINKNCSIDSSPFDIEYDQCMAITTPNDQDNCLTNLDSKMNQCKMNCYNDSCNIYNNKKKESCLKREHFNFFGLFKKKKSMNINYKPKYDMNDVLQPMFPYSPKNFVY